MARSRVLEPHDELGLPWDEWADRRVHRLAKGRDFLRSSEAVEEAAQNAARRLGLVVCSMSESRFGRMYVWFQFADYEIDLGDACGCGSTDLYRVTLRFAQCGSCGASILLRPTKRDQKADRNGDADADDAMLQALFAGPDGVPTRNGRKRRADQPKVRRKPLSFSDLKLVREGARYRGHGLGPDGELYLVVLEPAGSLPGPVGDAAAVPVEPFGELLDLEALDRLEPEVELETAELPLVTQKLDDFAEASLFWASRDDRSETYAGWGRATEGGETLLVTVRYRLRGGERVAKGQNVCTVPLDACSDLVDVDALLARDPDLQIPSD